jgi:hypothetical protein
MKYAHAIGATNTSNPQKNEQEERLFPDAVILVAQPVTISNLVLRGAV